MMWLTYVSMLLLLLIGVFLIFIILLQRGRGGGLAGALGGMGGQSAFGTKAGDMFTRITVVLAVVWIALCAGQIPLLRAVSGNPFKGGTDSPQVLEAPAIKGADGKKVPADDELKDSNDQDAAETGDKTTEPAQPKPDAKKSDDSAEKPATSETDALAEEKATEATPPKSSEAPAEEKPTEDKPKDESDQ